MESWSRGGPELTNLLLGHDGDLFNVLHLLTKWHPEDDPLTRAQVDVLLSLLGGLLTETALEGFLIVCSRLELARIFRTNRLEGKLALLRSLEHVKNWVGGMEAYERVYPVTIIPPRPAFPLFKIIGIESVAAYLYRVFDSRSNAHPTDEPVKDYIKRTGRLPAVPRQRRPVRRSKPRYHWCSYEKWDDPEYTRQALQILPEWSDCQLRATIRTLNIRRSAYVAFNGDRFEKAGKRLRFEKYYFEPLAQDHPPLIGGGPQIGLEGAPLVDALEQWDDVLSEWRLVWVRGNKSLYFATRSD